MASTGSNALLTILVKDYILDYYFPCLANLYSSRCLAHFHPLHPTSTMPQSLRPAFQLVPMDEGEESALGGMKWHGIAQCIAHFPAKLVGCPGAGG